jgi:hypothetical protein
MSITKKDLIDQSSHAAVAFVATAGILIAPGILTAALAGFLFGLVRELTEEGTKITGQAFRNVWHSRGSKIDIAFWTLGGALAGLFFA